MTGERPRILMLITELQMGGAARVVRELSAMLSRTFEVHEAVFNAADGVDFPGSAPPHDLDVRGGAGLSAKLANIVRRVIRARRLKRSLRVDISISHLEGAHYVDLLSRQGEKIILCVHGSILDRGHCEPPGWLQRKLLIPRLYRRADAIVTVSRDIASQLVAMGIDKEKIRTINNFFDVEEIAAKAAEPLPAGDSAIFDDTPVLIASGRLAEQKNQRPLIEILAALKSEQPVKLVLLGDGPLRDSLVERAEDLGLKTHRGWTGEPLRADRDVYFLGNRANPFPYLARSSLFLLPSSWEGFPLTLCEAMACGLPVLASDCPTGPREILAPETAKPAQPIWSVERGQFGMLMPMIDNPATAAAGRRAWIGAIRDLLDDSGEWRRLTEAGRARVADFTPDKIVPQWLKLIGELLEPRRATTDS